MENLPQNTSEIITQALIDQILSHQPLTQQELDQLEQLAIDIQSRVENEPEVVSRLREAGFDFSTQDKLEWQRRNAI